MLFNDYSLMGYNMARTSINPKEIQSNGFVYFGKEAEIQEQAENIFREIPNEILESKPYRPMANLLIFTA